MVASGMLTGGNPPGNVSEILGNQWVNLWQDIRGYYQPAEKVLAVLVTFENYNYFLEGYKYSLMMCQKEWKIDTLWIGY